MKTTMWRAFARLAALSGVVVLAACGSHGQLRGPASSEAYLQPVREDLATVVFLREGGTDERVPLVLANDRVVGSLLPGRYAFGRVCAGNTMVGSADRAAVVARPVYRSETTQAREVVYLQITEPASGAASGGSFGLHRLNAEDGRAAVGKLEMHSHIIDRHVPDCKPAVAPAPARAPVAPPSVVPVVVPTPVVSTPVVLERVQLGADTLFQFDGRSVDKMLPAGRASLDNLAQTVRDRGLQIERLRLIGHTDRLGSVTYNQKLSEDRAQTVAAYLRQRGLTQPMDVSGAGESQPVTTSCSGNRPTPQLVTCLSPDRRVVIELIGLQQP